MGLFSKFKDAVSEALPTIGGTVGMALGGPIGAAFGSGIGTLAQGRDIEDAMKNAAIGGAVGYAGQKFFGVTQAPKRAEGIARFIPGREMSGLGAGGTQKAVEPLFGIGSKGSPTSSLFGGGEKEGGGLGLGSLTLGASLLGALASGEEEENNLGPARPQPEGEAFGTVSGPLSGEVYEINDPQQLAAYRAEQARIQSPEFTYDDIVRQRYGYKDGGEHIGGGEVTGPGTGTSDSVPARLSDGEFVITAKAVNGAGGGDRDIGAARLYDMMADLEAVA